MKQVVQSAGDGTLSVIDVPSPTIESTQVLVQTRRSLVSTGTERALRKLATSSLLEKARARPDLVQQVIRRARSEGLRSTIGVVRERLDTLTPLGYSAAGVVLESGEHAPHLPPGTRVATASVGHAEQQVVPGLLAVRIPDNVDDESAAFGAVAAIAMHGIHQADVVIGDTVLVVGLGLIGQLTARLAHAAGLRVLGVDVRTESVGGIARFTDDAWVEAGVSTTAAILSQTRGRGVDAVLLTASSSSSDIIGSAVDRVRDRGTVVVVGDVGLDLDRTPFYNKEVQIRFARSYGAGRYDYRYEGLALDYPEGYAPRTEHTNIEAFLHLVSSGRVTVSDLVSRVFPLTDAAAAYDLVSHDPSVLAIQFEYDVADRSRSIALAPSTSRRSAGGAAMIGAGDYAKAVFIPAMRSAGWDDIRVVVAASGLSARTTATKVGAVDACTDVADVLNRDDVDTLFVLTRHDTHADLAARGLRAGKNVFVEKPLALTWEQLDDVVAAVKEGGAGHLGVGFNRRFSEPVARARQVLAAGSGPVTVHFRVAAGSLPAGHWLNDRRQGGRAMGEVCHFVDTATCLVGSRPVEVSAFGASHEREALLQEDCTFLVSYADGSSATISYVTGAHASTGKEFVEVLGRGHSIVIDDFTKLEIDGRHQRLEVPGKGHVQCLEHFRALCREGAPRDLEWLGASLSTTAVMLVAIESMTTGRNTAVPETSVTDA